MAAGWGAGASPSAVAAACFVWEAWSTRDRDPQACFRAFLHNNWVGLAIFVGIAASLALR